MAKILIVEDDSSIAMGLEFCLTQEGFLVECLNNGESAKNYQGNFDLMLLDLNLPDMHGFEVLKVWKDKVPVICLTACDEELSIVQGLDMGADDYVIKPFRTRELISRIKSVLRRYQKETKHENQIKHKNILIDIDTARVYKNGEEVILTSLEYKILLYLLSNKNIIITREKLLDQIWDIAGNFVNDNTLTVYIKRIREKLDDKDAKIIETVRGIGYRVTD